MGKLVEKMTAMSKERSNSSSSSGDMEMNVVLALSSSLWLRENGENAPTSIHLM